MNAAARMTASALRAAYRREALPARVRWWMAARATLDWYRLVEKELRPHLANDSRPAIASLFESLLSRRALVLRERHPHLSSASDRDIRLLVAALYRMTPSAKGAWLWSDGGGIPAGARQWARAHCLLLPMSSHDRWDEVTTHLGEWLIVLTTELPRRLPRARQLMGDICFRLGQRHAATARKMFGIPDRGAPDPDRAIEILRMTEYVFRVNPQHWASADGDTGYIEGSACPWYTRPGWGRMHCGIFGQFQSGISAEFGLSYKLTQTIPKHGGHTCRIDLMPIPLGKRA